ncbi:MAG: FecR family protein [Chitinophagaceae bacterium]|nr:FecR family protein [Chitinophagaceae bacterium]
MKEEALVRYLLKRYIDDQATEKEKLQLFGIIREYSDDAGLARILQELGLREEADPGYESEYWDVVVQSILAEAGKARSLAPIRSFRRTMRYAAAVILALCALGIYFYREGSSGDVVKQQFSLPPAAPSDFPPGGEKAFLVLADGSKISLEKAGSGLLATQGPSSVEKLSDGRIVYRPVKTDDTGEVFYNTMQTPRGGQYQLILPDGSKVWLNAASSITYPASFPDSSRAVSITGEAYFEIKPAISKGSNRRTPFIVNFSNAGGLPDRIEVLGTHFNVNAYADEPYVKASLLEGSIRIGNQVLKPGEAYVNGKVSRTDIKQDISWKNGAFNFNGANLPTLMRQLGRWYDIDVSYKGNIPVRRFQGKLSMDLSLPELLDVLQTLEIYCKIEGRKVIVGN